MKKGSTKVARVTAHGHGGDLVPPSKRDGFLRLISALRIYLRNAAKRAPVNTGSSREEDPIGRR